MNKEMNQLGRELDEIRRRVRRPSDDNQFTYHETPAHERKIHKFVDDRSYRIREPESEKIPDASSKRRRDDEESDHSDAIRPAHEVGIVDKGYESSSEGTDVERRELTTEEIHRRAIEDARNHL